MIHLIIPAIPPSNNQYQGKGGMGKNFLYQEDKKRWAWLMKAAYLEGKKLSEPYEKSLVHIKYFFPDRRRRDPDNYSGKMLLDPLTEMGIIKDDSFSCIQLKIEGGYDKENPRTEIRITRLEGER